MKHLKSFLIVCVFISYAITGIASNVKYKVVFDTDFIINTKIAADGNIYSITLNPQANFKI